MISCIADSSNPINGSSSVICSFDSASGDKEADSGCTAGIFPSAPCSRMIYNTMLLIVS